MYSLNDCLRVKARNINLEDGSASVVASTKMAHLAQQFRKKQTVVCKFKKTFLQFGNERGAITLSIHYIPATNIYVYKKLEEVAYFIVFGNLFFVFYFICFFMMFQNYCYFYFILFYFSY